MAAAGGDVGDGEAAEFDGARCAQQEQRHRGGIVINGGDKVDGSSSGRVGSLGST